MAASLPDALPDESGSPGPRAVPARARRMGGVPAPRVRPLAEVLPGWAAPEPDPGAQVRTHRAQDELDRLAAGLRPVAARLLAALADVLGGRRPPGHLDGLLTPGALETLVRAAPPPRPAGTTWNSPANGRSSGPSNSPAARPGPGAALRGLRVCATGPRVAEVAAVVHGRDRVRALAARLERTDDGPADPGRWRVAALWPG